MKAVNRQQMSDSAQCPECGHRLFRSEEWGTMTVTWETTGAIRVEVECPTCGHLCVEERDAGSDTAQECDGDG